MGRGRRLLVLGAGPAQLGVLAAARRRGLAVVAADRDPAAPGFRHADRRALVSIEDEPTVGRFASVLGFVDGGRFVPLRGAREEEQAAPVAAAAAVALGIERGAVTARVVLTAAGPLLARLSAHAGDAPEADDLVVAAALGEPLAAAVIAA